MQMSDGWSSESLPQRTASPTASRLTWRSTRLLHAPISDRLLRPEKPGMCAMELRRLGEEALHDSSAGLRGGSSTVQSIRCTSYSQFDRHWGVGTVLTRHLFPPPSSTVTGNLPFAISLQIPELVYGQRRVVELMGGSIRMSL